MKGNVILRVVFKNKRYPEGALEGYCYADGRGKSKQCSLHVHTPEIAYETIDLWAEDMAKEHGLEYQKKTLAELLKTLKIGSNRPADLNRGSKPEKPSDGITTGTNRSILSSEVYFKAEIRRVFMFVGQERLKKLFATGVDLVDSLESEFAKQRENLDNVRASMAKTMHQSYLDTGIDMTEFCSDDVIISKFNQLKADAGKLL